MSATLGERASNEVRAESGARPEATKGKLGVSVEPATPELAAQLRLPQGTKGLVVRDVDPEGAAAEAGIQQGDLILEFNRQAVASIEELRVAMNGANGRPRLMLVNRQGANLFVTVRIK